MLKYTPSKDKAKQFKLHEIVNIDEEVFDATEETFGKFADEFQDELRRQLDDDDNERFSNEPFIELFCKYFTTEETQRVALLQFLLLFRRLLQTEKELKKLQMLLLLGGGGGLSDLLTGGSKDDDDEVPDFE